MDVKKTESQTFSVLSHEEEEEKPLYEYEDDNFEVIGHLPSPPDGGWGWIIVFASFACNLVLDGICYTFGVLLQPMVESFDSSASSIALVGSLLAGVYLTSGPIVGGLVNKFGCRPVCMAGSVVASLGLLLSTLSPNVEILMVTYGIIGGLGLGLIYLPSVVAVGYYFEKKRSLATGISVCGSGVGTFLLAPLVTYLEAEYGWKGANIICAGLCLNCAVFGALMRPLELIAVKNKKIESLNNFVVQLPDGSQQTSNSHLSQLPSSTIPALPTITEQSITVTQVETHKSLAEVFPDFKRPRNKKRTTSESASKFSVTPVIPRNSSAPHFNDPLKGLSRNSSTPGLSRYHSKLSSEASEETYFLENSPEHNFFSKDSSSALNLRPGTSSIGGLQVRPLYRKDIFYSGSITNLLRNEENRGGAVSSILSPTPRSSRHNSQYSIHRGSLVASVLSIPPSILKEPKGPMDENVETPMLSAIQSMLSLHLLSNSKFLLLGASNFMGMLGFYVPFVYLPDMVVGKGIERSDANFLLSIIGISNTFGRVFCGWLSDFYWVDALFVTNVATLLSGIFIFIFPFFESYEAFFGTALLFGLAVAAYISLTSIVIVDLLGLDNLTSAFGLLVLFRGLSSMIGAPLAGAVYDMTKSYNISFFMAGSFLMVASLLSTIAFILQRKELKAKEKEGKPE